MLSYVWKTGLFELAETSIVIVRRSRCQRIRGLRHVLQSRAPREPCACPGNASVPSPRFPQLWKTLWKTSSRPTDIQICSVFVRLSVLKPQAVEFRSLYNRFQELRCPRWRGRTAGVALFRDKRNGFKYLGS